jgi:hypothetical protein
MPPAAPAIAAPPATSGTFALLAALPTVFPALLALPPTSPTALRTASTGLAPPLEPLLEREPFELWDFELGDLGFGFEARVFAVLALAFDWDFDFDDDLALFGVDRFLVWV